MNTWILAIALLLVSYLLGSIPFGLLIVKLTTGKDIRTLESGRTGGTNVGRVAGFWAGVATAFMDGFKALVTVWIARGILPGNPIVHALAPVMAILGHNYSIYLLEKLPGGKVKLRGGAGGASAVGGAVGLWAPSFLIIVPVAILALFGLGYASVATMSVGISAIVIFALRNYLGIDPWQYILYGIFAEAILLWALRPNIVRLIQGTERMVGWRAKRQKRSQ